MFDVDDKKYSEKKLFEKIKKKNKQIRNGIKL